MLLTILPTTLLARDFEYTYEGQTITYTVIDEDTKTCMTKEGHSSLNIPGNNISGDLVLPERPLDGEVQFTLTSISAYSFYLCRDLTSIVIPTSVNALGNGAFSSCSNLTSIELPNTVTRIGADTFDGCKNLSYIEIPSSITYIGEGAFRHCENLLSMSIPNSVASIKSGTFAYCYKLNSISLPETLTSIGNSAFSYCYGLQSIILPASVTSIDNWAFSGCNNLMSIVYNAATPIECSENNFSEVTYWYGNLNMPNADYTDIKAIAPWNKFKHVTSSQRTYEILDDGDFEYEGIIYSVIDAEQRTCATRKGNQDVPGNLFEGDLIIPNTVSDGINEYSVTEVGFWGFVGCKITSVTLNEPIIGLGTECFKNCIELTSAKLPESLTRIVRGAFYGCEKLTSINLPPSLTDIGTSAFESCYSLTSITLPASLEKLGLGVFSNCINLETVTYYSSNPITSTSRTMFAPHTYQTATLVMPNASLDDILNTSIWNKFRRIQSKDENYIKHLDAGEDFEFEGIKYTVIDRTAHTCKTKAGKSDIDPGNSYAGDLVIPQVVSDGVDDHTVIAIGEYGFSECSKNLKSVSLPESVTSIGHDAFSWCTSLKTVYLPQSLFVIEDKVFNYCNNLTSINLPETLTSIGNEAFYYCSKLSSISLPNSVKNIGAEAFYGCSELTSVIIPSSVTSIAEGAFGNCSSLSSMYSFRTNPPNIQSSSIPSNLSTLYVPKGCKDIYEKAECWGEINDIREMGAVAISIDKNELSLFADDEPVKIAINITYDDDIIIQSQVWSSSDTSVATVDDNGVVTAVGEGQADIILTVTDNYGQESSACCAVTIVQRVLVSGIQILSDLSTLKKNRTTSLFAKILPENATNKSFTWTSSDETIASIDQYGNVNTKNAGTVIFTAAATDGSNVTSTFEMTIIPPTKGDSNDDDRLVIDDAVRTANYAIGIEDESFCFEAADINGDNNITIGDAYSTIKEILKQDTEVSGRTSQNISAPVSHIDCEYLVVKDFNLIGEQKATVDVALDNSVDYVALQADIFVPEGMTITAVEPGPRATADHSLIQRKISDNYVRVILFDANNNAFAANQDPILRITVMSENLSDGFIQIDNIHASDSASNGYTLAAEDYYFSDTSGLEKDIINSNINIGTTLGGLLISNAEGKEVRVYNIEGVCVDRFIADSNSVSRTLAKGVYLVTSGNKTAKIIIR